MNRGLHRPRWARPQGMATLSVVMVLFFIMAMVAAYTNRNLIFEQRVATNSYRAEQALASAEGGVDWAILMLNSGRVDMSCRPSTAAGDLAPRSRFLLRETGGGWGRVQTGASIPLFASCVVKEGALTCVCPTEATPDPSPHAVKDWPIGGGGTAFRVNFAMPGFDSGSGLPEPTPGAIVADVVGCGSPGHGDTSCAISQTDGTKPEVDGIARVRQTLGLVRALPVPPTAVLTAGGAVSAGGTALKVSNPDAATGMTVQAGGNITLGAGSQLTGPAGDAGDGAASVVAALASVVPTEANRFTNNDVFFRAQFGMEAPTYRRQPAVVRIDCTAGCTATDLRNQLTRYPGLTLWFDGDLDLSSVPPGGSLGTVAEPAMVIVTQQLRVAAALDLQGFFYARNLAWTGAASTATLRGAMVVMNDAVFDAPATLVYEPGLLRNIQLYYGSFVRAPGGWNRPI